MKEDSKKSPAVEDGSYLNKVVWNVSDVMKYMGVTKDYVYRLTSNKLIPHYKPMGKKVFFKRTEIEEWLLTNKVNTSDDVESEVEALLYEKLYGQKRRAAV